MLGFDILDFVFRLERRLRVKIKHEETDNITLGELHELICQKSNAKVEGGIATQKSLEFLYENLNSIFELQEKDIREDTRVEEIFQIKERKAMWKTFQEKAQIKLPELMFSKRIDLIKLVICGIIALVPAGSLAIIIPWSKSETLFILTLIVSFGLLVLFFSVIVFCVLASLANKLFLKLPVAIYIPPECQTIRSMATSAAAYNPERFMPWGRKDIWNIIEYVLDYEQGIDPERIKPETKIESFMTERSIKERAKTLHGEPRK